MSRVELRILNKPQLPVTNNRFGNYTSGWLASLTAQTSAPDLAVFTGTTNYTTLDGWSHGGTNLYSAYLRSNLGSTKTTWQDLTGEIVDDCFYKIEFDVLGASGGTITPILFGVTGTTTPVGPASVVTIEPTFLANVTGCTTIYTGGIIDDDGGAPVTARGIVWGYTDPYNTMTNATYSGTGIGTYEIQISGVSLWSYRTYYIRAFATNSVKTQYGNLVTITMLRPNGGGPCDTVEYTISGGEPCTVFIGCGLDGGVIAYRTGGSACDPGCGVFDGGDSCYQDTTVTISGGTACIV